MASDYDATEFVDTDFQAHKSPQDSVSALAASMQRAPTREEVDSKVAEAQQKLAELKRAQEELERERSALEEVRRRQMEFQTGRQEMIHNLTRGLGLLEETEFNSRRDAEQMAKSIVDLREALAKVQAVHEETWTKDNFNVELTRALTAIENARMEWNSSRLKYPVLSGQTGENATPEGASSQPMPLGKGSFAEQCRLGLALTWPITLVALLGWATVLLLWLHH